MILVTDVRLEFKVEMVSGRTMAAMGAAGLLAERLVSALIVTMGVVMAIVLMIEIAVEQMAVMAAGAIVDVEIVHAVTDRAVSPTAIIVDAGSQRTGLAAAVVQEVAMIINSSETNARAAEVVMAVKINMAEELVRIEVVGRSALGVDETIRQQGC